MCLLILLLDNFQIFIADPFSSTKICRCAYILPPLPSQHSPPSLPYILSPPSPTFSPLPSLHSPLPSLHSPLPPLHSPPPFPTFSPYILPLPPLHSSPPSPTFSSLPFRKRSQKFMEWVFWYFGSILHCHHSNSKVLGVTVYLK